VSGLASAIYVGEVVHARLRPRRHVLRYGVYSLLIDLDELPLLAARSRLFSHNRFNLFSLHDADFGEAPARPLRAQVEDQLRAAGIETGGAIRLFAMPRVLGHVFNPISVFFCHRKDGSLAAMLYEVHNTFGERHAYLAPVAPRANEVVEQEASKEFHVSPFMDMGMTYRFRISPPGEDVAIRIEGRDEAGALIVASQTGARRNWSDAALARVFVAYPLVTLKVVVGIHFEALRIWLKGVGVRSKPAPPGHFTTLGSAVASRQGSDP